LAPEGSLGWRLEEADEVADGVVTVVGVPSAQVFVHDGEVAATRMVAITWR
jgi:hypothetical protein